jgi:hypothetical protein
MDPTAEMQQLSQQLREAVEELCTVVSGGAHGILRGSHEAALAEAQGAQIVRNVAQQGATFEHILDIENTGAAILDRLRDVQGLLGKIGEIDPGVMRRSKEALQPLIETAESNVELIEETQGVAADLTRNFGNRLTGVYFGQGGLGPQVGRSFVALISTQINQMAVTLRARGIEPNLIPSEFTRGRMLMQQIQQLPVTIEDAFQRMAGALAAVRALLTQSAIRAAANTASSSFLRFLSAAFEGLFTISGRLVTLPIIILPPGLLKDRQDQEA